MGRLVSMSEKNPTPSFVYETLSDDTPDALAAGGFTEDELADERRAPAVAEEVVAVGVARAGGAQVGRHDLVGDLRGEAPLVASVDLQQRPGGIGRLGWCRVHARRR